MIALEKTEVVGWEAAIRGMRNPMNSWEKSDSSYEEMDVDDFGYKEYYPLYIPSIGPNDLELMKKLRNSGTDHRKFMRMIIVYVDITAPLYWWKEFDTYKVGTVANSCSTMHKIAAKEFTVDDFSHEHLTIPALAQLESTIDVLNEYREWYLAYDHMSEKDKEPFIRSITCSKDLWWQMIQLLPSSYNQKRTVMMSYEVLANVYKSRKDHKLDEWRKDYNKSTTPGIGIVSYGPSFCDWIKELPHSELITGDFV